MKKTKIIYWIFTGLLIAGMLLSAIPEILGLPQGNEFLKKLQYPEYLNFFLGIAKIMGLTAILVPRYPRLKEWAYAGFFFDLAGATYSQIASGMPLVQCAFMLIWFVVLFGSYIYYHKLKPAPAI